MAMYCLRVAGFFAATVVAAFASPSDLPLAAVSGRIGDAWSDPRNPIVRIFHGERLDLWSLKPVRRLRTPEPRHLEWCRNEVDRFVLARLESEGLGPSPVADRRTLLRRLTFDLAGRPPTFAEVSEFLADTHPDAYERRVERLLGSREYGEHSARMWLDVLRYSDSNGFDWDEYRPAAWRFRDYIIRSLNADKPFPELVVEMLAGDELMSGEPKDLAEQDRWIATGYLRLGPQDNSAAAFNEQGRHRAELMADLTETTASAFLGLTLSCCRCHDHKTEPISQADHYRMRAFFEPAKYADDVPLDLAERQKGIRLHNLVLEDAIRPIRQERTNLMEAIRGRLRGAKRSGLSREELALLEKGEMDPAVRTNRSFIELRKKITPTEAEIEAARTGEEKAMDAGWKAAIVDREKERRKFTFGLLMTDSADPPPPTRVLAQGDYRRELQAVEPGVLSVLDPEPLAIQPPTNSKTSGRRLALARWIVSTNNPLSARVLVNRIWQGHFGRGIVSTPNDFGFSGARPSHPELLDWLASEFHRNGGRLKPLHRMIVLSTTYRQASHDGTNSGISGKRRKDPENAWLSYGPARRLTAEQLRDALLDVSGLLVSRQGGSPVWPRLPDDVLQANPAFLDDNAEKTKGWYPSPKEVQSVRSVYLVQKRTVKVPMLETFDLPENATSCGRRDESIVAPQALTLLNHPWVQEVASAMGARIMASDGGDVRRQIDRAFQLTFQRMPDRTESDRAREFLRDRTLEELCRSLVNLNEFLEVD